MTSIGGDFRLNYQYSLTNFTGLEALTSIGGSIIIGSSHLDNLTGLSSITSLGGGLYLTGNVYLASLLGLETLTSIGGGISIIGHNNITNLFGLENITSIGGGLRIGWNNGLTNLTGLENIDPSTIDSLSIIFNYDLPSCEVQSICDYLVSPVGSIEIHDNAPGCNSQAAVEEACEAIGIAEIVPNIEFSIYPNPTSDKLYITSNNGLKIETVNIYNQLGYKVLHLSEIRENIDISTLGQGIYIIEVTSGELKIRKKLIIE